MATKKKAPETASEPVQEAAEGQETQEPVQTENAAQDTQDAFVDDAPDVGELLEYVEYAVQAEHGLNLREQPSLDAPVVAVLPCGSGVVLDASQEATLGWLPVRTGILYGWVREDHLAYV